MTLDIYIAAQAVVKIPIRVEINPECLFQVGFCG
jgi:hypothetical protein